MDLHVLSVPKTGEASGVYFLMLNVDIPSPFLTSLCNDGTQTFTLWGGNGKKTLKLTWPVHRKELKTCLPPTNGLPNSHYVKA